MRKLLRNTLAATAALACAGAMAGLGGPPDLPAAASSRHATPSQVPYTVVQGEAERGLSVSEYVDANGVVFAVTWTGPGRPDLSRLLGARFAAFKAQAPHAPSRGNGGRRVDSDDLVVVSGGHMGALRGSAWIPSMLPDGFDPGDIQ